MCIIYIQNDCALRLMIKFFRSVKCAFHASFHCGFTANSAYINKHQSLYNVISWREEAVVLYPLFPLHQTSVRDEVEYPQYMRKTQILLSEQLLLKSQLTKELKRKIDRLIDIDGCIDRQIDRQMLSVFGYTRSSTSYRSSR